MTKYSKFGEQFRGETGTRQLMDDLGEVLSSGRSIMNLGGGNPGVVPEVSALLRQRMQDLLNQGDFDDVVGKYEWSARSPTVPRSPGRSVEPSIRLDDYTGEYRDHGGQPGEFFHAV